MFLGRRRRQEGAQFSFVFKNENILQDTVGREGAEEGWGTPKLWHILSI
jgi:hypothetical protein